MREFSAEHYRVLYENSIIERHALDALCFLVLILSLLGIIKIHLSFKKKL